MVDAVSIRILHDDSLRQFRRTAMDRYFDADDATVAYRWSRQIDAARAEMRRRKLTAWS